MLVAVPLTAEKKKKARTDVAADIQKQQGPQYTKSATKKPVQLPGSGLTPVHSTIVIGFSLWAVLAHKQSRISKFLLPKHPQWL